MRRIIIILLVAANLVLGGLISIAAYTAGKEYYEEHKYDRVYSIYKEIIAATGQAQNRLPLYVVETDIENAYNDGHRIIIYTGLIDRTESWDEVALVLGHEVAHGNLGHLDELNTDDPNKITVLEANADKMGAVYMMKAGYNICVAREIYKRWKNEHGNALAQDHPDFSYRYDELNINCGE